MSDVLYEGRGLQLSRHVGPASEGPDRRRWQLTTGPEGYAVMTAGELTDLHAALTLALYQVLGEGDPVKLRQAVQFPLGAQLT